MKKISLLFSLTIALLLAGGSAYKASAQSTVYLCYDVQFWKQEIPIKINGQEAFSLMGDAKKVGALVMFTRSKKKCTLHSEGKVILSFDFDVTIPITDAVIPYSDEIQLNLSENSVHYIAIKPVMKGNKMVFEELSEKEGEKEFASKKYTHNPDYDQPQE